MRNDLEKIESKSGESGLMILDALKLSDLKTNGKKMFRYLQLQLESFVLLKFRAVGDSIRDINGKCLVCKRDSRFYFNSWIVSKDIEIDMKDPSEFQSLLARESFFCKFCLTSDRKRSLYKHLLKYISEKTKIHIEDLCKFEGQLSILIIGDLGKHGYLQRIVSEHLMCTTTYFNPEEAIGTRKNHMINANIEDLSFLDTEFDVIIHTDVLEHCSNPTLAVESCLQTLKNDGVIIFTIPIRSNLDLSFSTLNKTPKIWHGRGKWVFSFLPKLDGYFERHIFGRNYAQYLNPTAPERIVSHKYSGSYGNEIAILQMNKSTLVDKL